MEIIVSTEQGRVPVTVLHVNGNIDSASYEEFLSRAEALIQGGARDLLVDLEHAPFVSSAGLRALNTLFGRLRSLSPDVSDEEMHKGINAGTYRSPHLKLLNPSEASIMTLEASGFSMFISSFKDLKAAIASF